MGKKEVGILFLIGVLVIHSGCISKTAENDGQKEYVIGYSSDTLGFYPWIEAYDVDTMSINSNMFNSLVELDDSMRLTPGLARTWSNPDDFTWRFTLRDGVTFHNGYPLTAEDVKYTIDSIIEDEDNDLRGLLTAVSEVNIVDNLTVDIVTKEQYPILLNNLLDVFIVSKKYQEETDTHWPIGTGAYKLVDYVEGTSISFELNDLYWKGPPDIRRFMFKIIEDSEEKKNALLDGTIDLSSFKSDYYEEVKNSNGLVIKTITSPTIFYICYDFREYGSVGYGDQKNPFSDVLVRKAVYHAIDIESIIEDELNGFGTAATQFVSPMIYGYNPDIERLDYDANLSQQLLTDAGYEEGFSVIFDCTDDNGSMEICTILADQLSAVGINATLNPLGPDEFYDKILTRNSQFYILGWLAATADGGEIFDYLLRSVDDENGIGTYNLGYYSNALVDEIGENVSKLMDLEERLELMQEGFSIAMDEVAWVPLYSLDGNYAYIEELDWTPRADLNIKVEEITIE